MKAKRSSHFCSAVVLAGRQTLPQWDRRPVQSLVGLEVFQSADDFADGFEVPVAVASRSLAGADQAKAIEQPSTGPVFPALIGVATATDGDLFVGAKGQLDERAVDVGPKASVLCSGRNHLLAPVGVNSFHKAIVRGPTSRSKAASRRRCCAAPWRSALRNSAMGFHSSIDRWILRSAS